MVHQSTKSIDTSTIRKSRSSFTKKLQILHARKQNPVYLNLIFLSYFCFSSYDFYYWNYEMKMLFLLILGLASVINFTTVYLRLVGLCKCNGQKLGLISVLVYIQYTRKYSYSKYNRWFGPQKSWIMVCNITNSSFVSYKIQKIKSIVLWYQ